MGRGLDLDVDWNPDQQLLTWLAAGSGVRREQLEAMTLQAYRPGSERDWFALSEANFAGGHAFCPQCAREQDPRRGDTVLLGRDAGLWRIACPQHGVLLDGVLGLKQVSPRRQRSGHSLSGAIGVGGPPVPAASLFLAFQRTAERAQLGHDPGAGWLVRDPGEFIRVATELAPLVLIRNCSRQSAVSAMLGWALHRADWFGDEFLDRDWLARMPAPIRVKALCAVALLISATALPERRAFTSWLPGVGDPWLKLCLSRHPWAAAASAWRPHERQLVREMSATWPDPLRTVVSSALVQEAYLLLLPEALECTGALKRLRRSATEACSPQC